MAEPNTDKLPNKNPLFMIEEEQREHIAKLNKMEREMEEVSWGASGSDLFNQNPDPGSGAETLIHTVVNSRIRSNFPDPDKK